VIDTPAPPLPAPPRPWRAPAAIAGLQKNAGVRTVVIAEFLDGGPTAAFDR
jgi:hypothetical protein